MKDFLFVAYSFAIHRYPQCQKYTPIVITEYLLLQGARGRVVKASDS